MKVEIKKEHGAYWLSVTHNGWQWTSVALYNTEEMRQVAKVLLEKANEIETESEVKSE